MFEGVQWYAFSRFSTQYFYGKHDQKLFYDRHNLIGLYFTLLPSFDVECQHDNLHCWLVYAPSLLQCSNNQIFQHLSLKLLLLCQLLLALVVFSNLMVTIGVGLAEVLIPQPMQTHWFCSTGKFLRLLLIRFDANPQTRKSMYYGSPRDTTFTSTRTNGCQGCIIGGHDCHMVT